ncbi:hypothetical protein ACLMJK_005292 [Lecanora helva]
MASPPLSAPEKSAARRAAHTSESKHLKSSWRKSEERLDQLAEVPRCFREASWRKREGTAASLLNTTHQHFQSPWNRPKLRSPVVASFSPRDKLEPDRVRDFSCTPWHKAASGCPRTEMLPDFCKLSTTQMPDQLESIDGAEANQAEVRPRLQLQIPARHKDESETVPSSLQTGVSTQPGTADISPSSRQELTQLDVSSSTPCLESTVGESGADVSISATQASGVAHDPQIATSPSANEETASSSTQPEKALPTRVATRSASKPHTDLEVPTVSSPFASQNSTFRDSQITSTNRTESTIRSHPSGPTSIQATAPNSRFSLGQATQMSHAERPSQTLHTGTPGVLQRRPGYANHFARGGPGRRTFANQTREATHSNSRTWVNPRTQLQAVWAEVYRRLKDMSIIKESQESPSGAIIIAGGGSFCVPRTFSEWVEHRTELGNDKAKAARQRLRDVREHQTKPRHRDLPPAGETAPVTIMPYKGKQWKDGRSSMLCLETIWTNWLPRIKRDEELLYEERSQALWPCAEEMKEEGNERNTSQYRRFLALPRVPGNPTVNWKQKKILPMLPFDEVWKRPSKQTYLDQRAVISPREREYMELVLGQNLLDAIDCKISDDEDEA